MAKRKGNPEEKHRKMVADIMKVFRENAGKPFNYKEMTEALGLKSKSDRMTVQDLLFEMAGLGMIAEAAAGKFRLPAEGSEKGGSTITGYVDMTASGSAFIIPVDKKRATKISLSPRRI